MKISIVIPAHNGEKYLSEAISSAMCQTRPADEILIVDDNSKDSTREIACSDRWGKKVKYKFNEFSTGFVDAWNRAISASTGDFVTILHQDDLLDQDYLLHVHNALLKYGHVKHIYSACTYIDQNGRHTARLLSEPASFEPILYSGQRYARNYLQGVVDNCHIHRCPGVTTERNLLVEKCTYRKEAGHIADDDFFMRVGAFTDVVGISAPLASYRNHPQSETGRSDDLSFRLATDYIFQMKSHRKAKSLLDETGLRSIDRLAVRFINLLLFQSLQFERDDWTAAALELKEEFETITSKRMVCFLPKWAGPLWAMTKAVEDNRSAKFYAAFIRGLLSTRNALRSKKFP